MFLYWLKDPYELLFIGCSLSCKRVDHFVIKFVYSTTKFRELSFLEVNSPLPYLACKWWHHHSSDESLFSFIPVALMYSFDSCSVLNCSPLKCFHLLGFIGPLFQIWVNFALFGLIFLFNYF